LDLESGGWHWFEGTTWAERSHIYGEKRG
jgi:hypothetical protein